MNEIPGVTTTEFIGSLIDTIIEVLTESSLISTKHES